MDVIPPLRVPAREIPVPASLSPAARASFEAPALATPPYPAVDDTAGWRLYAAEQDKALLSFIRAMRIPDAADVEDLIVGNARVYQITPHEPRVSDDCVYLDIHGGALVMGGGELCLAMGKLMSARRGVRFWSVDYRLPPDHPYPAPLDDCLDAYRALLQAYRPENIIVGGGSAGGNLAAAMILRARDEGLPLPGGAVLVTPELDLTESGDSFQANLGLDSALTRSLMPANRLYAGGHDLRHPYLSPLFGDFSRGFSPTLLTAGTRDLFLSNAVRMHWALRAADVAAELYLLEAASHTGFANAPEGELLEREIDRFCRSIWRQPQ